MDRLTFARLLSSRVLVMDGAMGTELIKAGYSYDQCLEILNRDNPGLVKQIHHGYLQAGAAIISTNTFGANRLRLVAHGLAPIVADLVQRGVQLAKQVANGQALVALSVGPTAVQLAPDGPVTFTQLVEAFHEQIAAGVEAGADLISLETMMDLQEVKAAVIAARQVCNLPILAQVVFKEDGRTFDGLDPQSAAAILTNLDVDAIGANCGGGPESVLTALRAMREVSSLPLVAQPSAGMPIPGSSVYAISPQDMAGYLEAFAGLGARVIGSCCGSDANYTAVLVAAVKSLSVLPPLPNAQASVLVGKGSSLCLAPELPPLLIGERIHPGVRADLRNALLANDRQFLMDEAVEQRSSGAGAININVIAPGLDEPRSIALAVEAVQAVVSVPLSLNSGLIAALELGLQLTRGRPLLNAMVKTADDHQAVFSLARRYGAMVVGVPMEGSSARERLCAAQQFVEAALKAGLHPRDLVVDCVTQNATHGPEAVRATLDTIRLVSSQLSVRTLVGVSSVSVGMRPRSALNAAYAALAVEAGADILIGNPLQREVVANFMAAGQLMGRVPRQD